MVAAIYQKLTGKDISKDIEARQGTEKQPAKAKSTAGAAKKPTTTKYGNYIFSFLNCSCRTLAFNQPAIMYMGLSPSYIRLRHCILS